MAEKTEQPTPRRLRKLREQGDVSVSAALSQAAGFAAGVALLPSAFAAATATLAELVRVATEGRALSAQAVGVSVLGLTLPLLGAVAFTSAAVSTAQTGGLFAPARLAPSLDKLNLARGLRSLLSAQRLFGLLRSFATCLALAGVVFWVLRGGLAALLGSNAELRKTSAFALQSALHVARGMAAIALAVGVLDLVVSRRAFLRKNRMSRDEVRREHKESEGDPELKAARKRAHQEVLMSASVHAVREATVLIVNPTHLATALRYDEEREEAPRILSHGDGELARRMIEAAHAYGVPVVQDIPLAHALAELEAGNEIPEALYEAVAEILRTLWEAEQERASGKWP